MPTPPVPAPNIPTPVPQTSDPTNFAARADATLTAIPDTVDGLNDLADNVYDNAVEAVSAATDAQAVAELATAGTDYAATSTSTVSVSAGTKTVVIAEAGKAFADGDEIALVNRTDSSIRLYGVATDVTGQTITLDVAAEGVMDPTGAGGSYSSWSVVLGALMPAGATAGEVLALESPYVPITPLAFKNALTPYALTDAATVTPDGDLGWDFTWTIGGNRTLGNMTNAKVGQRGTIAITQDGTGSRVLAVGSAWKRQGGLGVLSTAAGAKDYLQYEVRAVDGSDVATLIVYALIKAPS